MRPDEIQQVFFQECEEGLVLMESSYQLVRSGITDPDTINGIFRAVHSIKGGAGALGHERLHAFTHHYEGFLDQLRTGTLKMGPEVFGAIIAAFDLLCDHVAAARDGTEPPTDGNVVERLAATDNVPIAPAPATVAVDHDFDSLIAMLESPIAEPWTVRIRPGRDALDHGAEPVLLLRELALLGGQAVVADLADLPQLDTLDPHLAYLGWTLTVPGNVDEAEIRAIFDFTEGYALDIARAQPLAETAPRPAPSPRAAPVATYKAETIRVDLDKLDRLVNLVGELVITQAMLAQRLSEHGLAKIQELTELDHLTRELQEGTMAIRAQPMKTVFSRLPRILRELETETGKRVRLEIEGEDTEVDRTVVERIGEPLTHLVRNAVDHGLEDPADRRAAGKPEEGLVRISAAHQSGRIVITVADDGRGIDRARVRAKAIERGIITADAVLADEEIDNLIFAPGFSTAETVSSVSGRGVGMDVVRKNVQALGGRIAIQSHAGAGSSFALSLPLTLAVLDGMIVTVGDQSFVVPLTHIVESLRPAPGEVRPIGAGAALFNMRGMHIPVHRIADRLGVAGAEEDPAKAVLIVVETEEGQAVLMVDGILDQRQVVVKSLEANYEAIHGVVGATILGDGRVALILDVDALSSRWRRGPTIGLAA